MIKLYYTGASAPLEPQTEPNKSLGGFISSTVIPNSRINTIFRDESIYSKSKNTPEVICIAIKNETAVDLENLKLFSEISETYEVHAAVVSPSEDSCSNLTFETLESQEELPYYGEFNNVTNLENEILLGTLSGNSYLGLFLQKKSSSQNDGNLSSSCEAIDFENQSQEDKKENFKLIFNWD